MIGDKVQVGFDVGRIVDGCAELKAIEIWVAGQLVTFRDNIGHISSISHCAQYDAQRIRNLKRFEHYFIGKDEKEVHQFILGTRVSDIEFKDSDEMFHEHQILDWGPNTDDVICFLIEIKEKLFITVEFIRDDESNQTTLDTVYSIEINEGTLTENLLHFSQVLCKS